MASLRFWDPARDSNTDIAQPNVLVDNYYRLVQQVQANVASFMRQYLAVHTTTGTAAALVVSQSNAGELRQKETPLSSADVASGITIQPHVAVSAGATLKVGSSPALPIYQTQGAALEAGVLEQARVYHLRLDVNELGAAVWVLVGYWPTEGAVTSALASLEAKSKMPTTLIATLTINQTTSPNPSATYNGDLKADFRFIHIESNRFHQTIPTDLLSETTVNREQFFGLEAGRTTTASNTDLFEVSFSKVGATYTIAALTSTPSATNTDNTVRVYGI